MAAKRGKKQARRKDEPSIPGYVWLLTGLLVGGAIAVAVWVKMPHAVDGLVPHPDPGAKPQVASSASSDVPEGNPPASAASMSADSSTQKKRKYDFYEVLPEREVVIPDEELSAQVKAEAAANLASKQQAALASGVASTAASPGAAVVANPATTNAGVTNAATAHPPATTATVANTASANPATTTNINASATATNPVATTHPATTANAETPAVTAAIPVPASQLKSGQYLLQAGAFRNNQQADDLKARIAMLGLVGRVETVQTPAGEMHRVRLGPYATASELESAKQKLGSGGVQAMAVRVK